MAFSCFIALVATGALLLFYYRPTPREAFDSILFLEASVFGGRYVRSLHRLASHLFLVLIFLHTLRVILTGAYAKPRERNWVIGFFLLCLAIFEAYTGYLLPLDQLALWATQTGMKLLETVPLGHLAKAVLVPDGVGEALSLIRFYVLHVIVAPIAVLFLSLLHFYHIRKNKGVLPYL
jgi:quinol-cytochrome oxidoreductase complex cytochrome b subunit